MSVGIAVRNPEGVLIAADTLCSDGAGHQFVHSKITYLSGHRAACLVFPVHGESHHLMTEWREPRAPASVDIRSTVLEVFEEQLPILRDHFAQLGDVHPSWQTPQVLVAGHAGGTGQLLRITDNELEEDPGGTVGVMVLGAWGELHDARERMAGVRLDALKTMSRASKFVRQLLAKYIADYEKTASLEGRRRRIGGPVELAVITEKSFSLERHGRVT